jgi:hypothetical protein
MTKQTSTTTVRLNPELIESLKVKAKEDGRSLNNLINRVLSGFIDSPNIDSDDTSWAKGLTAPKGFLTKK